MNRRGVWSSRVESFSEFNYLVDVKCEYMSTRTSYGLMILPFPHLYVPKSIKKDSTPITNSVPPLLLTLSFPPCRFIMSNPLAPYESSFDSALSLPVSGACSGSTSRHRPATPPFTYPPGCQTCTTTFHTTIAPTSHSQKYPSEVHILFSGEEKILVVAKTFLTSRSNTNTRLVMASV